MSPQLGLAEPSATATLRRMNRSPIRWSWLALPLAGPVLLASNCADTPLDDSAATTANLPYCEKLADIDTNYVETGTFDSATSGKIYGRLITEKSTDLHDPNYTANVEFTMQSVDVGGSQLVDSTDEAGAIVQTLGAGNWRIKLSIKKQGYTCSNEYELPVTAGDTTWFCLSMGCN